MTPPANPDLYLLHTDIEDSVRDGVRKLLGDRCPADRVLSCYEGNRDLVGPLWRALAVDLGLSALLVPEEDGGAGASEREAATVLEELGRFAAPVPFLTSAVIATTALRGSAAARDLLGALASGERTAALAVPWSTAPDESVAALRAAPDGGVVGEVTSVAGALESDTLLVPVTLAEGLALCAVPAAEAEVRPVVSFDMTRPLADLRFNGVRGQVVVTAPDATEAVTRALRTGAALLASEQFGVAQRCLETTVEYLRQRRQFGQVVGGYQALKHRLADLFVLVDSAGAAARYAAAALEADDPDVPVATAVAQAYCSPAAVRVAEEAVQLHGGIGMTWEHPLHLHLKRAKASSIALGRAGGHRARLAELVGLPLTD